MKDKNITQLVSYGQKVMTTLLIDRGQRAGIQGYAVQGFVLAVYELGLV